MKKYRVGMTVGTIFFIALGSWTVQQFTVATAGDKAPSTHSHTEGYTGSSSCRKCHEKFYQLWAPSHHGLAMQPYTPELGRKKLTPQAERNSHRRLPVSRGHQRRHRLGH